MRNSLQNKRLTIKTIRGIPPLFLTLSSRVLIITNFNTSANPISPRVNYSRQLLPSQSIRTSLPLSQNHNKLRPWKHKSPKPALSMAVTKFSSSSLPTETLREAAVILSSPATYQCLTNPPISLRLFNSTPLLSPYDTAFALSGRQTLSLSFNYIFLKHVAPCKIRWGKFPRHVSQWLACHSWPPRDSIGTRECIVSWMMMLNFKWEPSLGIMLPRLPIW